MKKKPSTIKKSHGQIATALKNEAKARGENPNDVYNQFFRETFLHALMVVEKTYEVQTEFLPSRFQISSYPIANQIADKVCAMYERHGDTPPGKASTRYRDLYDIALMARELSVTAIDLRIALRRQCEVRKLTLPERIALPDENWKTRYPITVQKLGGKYADLTSIDLALQIAGLLVDPILCGEIGTENLTWDYSSLQWA